MRRGVLTQWAAIGCCVLAGCASPATTPHLISTPSQDASSSRPCSDTQHSKTVLLGYPDVTAGGQTVTVRAAVGDVLQLSMRRQRDLYTPPVVSGTGLAATCATWSATTKVALFRAVAPGHALVSTTNGCGHCAAFGYAMHVTVTSSQDP